VGVVPSVFTTHRRNGSGTNYSFSILSMAPKQKFIDAIRKVSPTQRYCFNLEHLLRAIQEGALRQETIMCLFMRHRIHFGPGGERAPLYDLSLSLEDNLDNPELVALLVEVLDIQ
jgi:hypothetical protein